MVGLVSFIASDFEPLLAYIDEIYTGKEGYADKTNTHTYTRRYGES